MTLAAFLVYGGAVVVVIGIVLLFVPPGGRDKFDASGLSNATAEALKEFGALLDRFDKRFRPGLALMFVGLIMMAMGVYTETESVKNAHTVQGRALHGARIP